MLLHSWVCLCFVCWCCLHKWIEIYFGKMVGKYEWTGKQYGEMKMYILLCRLHPTWLYRANDNNDMLPLSVFMLIWMRLLFHPRVWMEITMVEWLAECMTMMLMPVMMMMMQLQMDGWMDGGIAYSYCKAKYIQITIQYYYKCKLLYGWHSFFQFNIQQWWCYRVRKITHWFFIYHNFHIFILLFSVFHCLYVHIYRNMFPSIMLPIYDDVLTILPIAIASPVCHYLVDLVELVEKKTQRGLVKRYTVWLCSVSVR